MKKLIISIIAAIICIGLIFVAKAYSISESATLSDWASPEELTTFLEADNTDRHLYLRANKQGVVKFNGVCEDQAIQLRDRAMAQGKYLSLVPLNYKEYQKWYSKPIDPGVYHLICGAVIGDNEFWYIEPNTDKIWLAQYFD